VVQILVADLIGGPDPVLLGDAHPVPPGALLDRYTAR
jgi:hypothetical protein